MPAPAKTKAAAAKPAPANPAIAAGLKKGDHVFLVDGSGYIFRAYHAIRFAPMTPDGVHVNAVYGFCGMLWKLLAEMKDPKPSHLAVIFDKSEKTFRTEMYKEYKAHRPPPPDDLIPQFPLIREAVRAFDIPCLEQSGFEADDLIATYARLACEAGATATLVSSDKDLMQLVNECVIMYDTMKDVRIGVPEVIEKFGVPPAKVIEVQSLIGDSSDNVPGVPGIGPKTAAELIGTYGDLETLLARVAEIKQDKRRQTLIDNAEAARISKRLVTLDQNVPLEVPIADLAVHEPDYPNLIPFLHKMGFKTLAQRVAEKAGSKATAATTPAAPTKSKAAAPALPFSSTGDLFPAPPKTFAKGGENVVLTPMALATKRAEELRAAKIDPSKYECVGSLDRLKAWIARAYETGTLALKTETNSIDPMRAALCGIALAVDVNEACYVPLGHRQAEGDEAGDSGLFAAKLCEGQIAEADALAALKPILQDLSVIKIGHDIKNDWLVLAQRGVTLGAYDDIMLMSYVVDAGRGAHDMGAVAERWLGRAATRFKDIKNKEKALSTPMTTPIERAAPYVAEDADVALRLYYALKPRMAAEHVTSVYETLERPMPRVLARMEQRGISIDQPILGKLSNDFAKKQAQVEQEINKIAGTQVNPGSPKQLGDILFGQMGLPGGTKTRTGQWSTGARALEELAEQGHELPQKILDWRQVSKLRSTYTEALPTYVNPTTNRVHTSYALASTSTGRLSSSEPNLQNIPIRTEEGRKIRRAFLAAPGKKLISADYSQIELRLLSEVAEVPALRKAFQDKVDIHAMTASEMFGVPVKGMPPDIRRRAKAINFGIIYGISAFGLAAQLAIPREEAGAYIKKYFERFPGIRAYMDETREFCRAKGYVLTLFGRKCHYPDIRSPNPSIRSFNERAAINARLQGSAADIIRRAMIRIEDDLTEQELGAQMLLQVHDELIFEAPENEVEQTMPLIKTVMEDAPHPAVNLHVPLQVDARAAQNWDEAH